MYVLLERLQGGVEKVWVSSDLEVIQEDVVFNIVKPGESLVEDMSPVTAGGQN